MAVGARLARLKAAHAAFADAVEQGAALAGLVRCDVAFHETLADVSGHSLVAVAVAVLGAGNGGCAAAADLTLEVRLYNRTPERLAPIQERGGIELLGVAGEGLAQLSLATTDFAEAVSGADVVVLCLPVSALTTYAPALAPLVAGDQVVFLNPGHMGGSLYLRRAAPGRRLHVCETSSNVHKRAGARRILASRSITSKCSKSTSATTASAARDPLKVAWMCCRWCSRTPGADRAWRDTFGSGKVTA